MAQAHAIPSNRAIALLAVMVVLGIGVPTLAAQIFGPPPLEEVPSRVILVPTPQAGGFEAEGASSSEAVEHVRDERHEGAVRMEAAIERFEKRSTVPVDIPELPAGARLGRFGYVDVASIGPGMPVATLSFFWPGHGDVHIEAGHVDLMGCDAAYRRWHATTIGKHPAVISADRDRTTILWPATSFRDTGRYSISGRFTETEIRALALDLMRPAGPAPVSRSATGC